MKLGHDDVICAEDGHFQNPKKDAKLPVSNHTQTPPPCVPTHPPQALIG